MYDLTQYLTEKTAIIDAKSPAELAIIKISNEISEDVAEIFEEIMEDLKKNDFKNSFNEEKFASRVELLLEKPINLASLSLEESKRLVICDKISLTMVIDEIGGFIPPEDYQYDSTEEAEANGQRWFFD